MQHQRLTHTSCPAGTCDKFHCSLFLTHLQSEHYSILRWANPFRLPLHAVSCDRAVADVNACITAPCKQATNNPAACRDLPAPAPSNESGRVCTCNLTSSTYVSEAVGCAGGCVQLLVGCV
jgi:hypothetical protein